MLPVEQPFKTYTGKDGKPLDNGYVYFGLPNQNPISAPVTVYWDAEGTIPASQPIRTDNGYIVCGGNAANVFFDGEYSILVQDSKKRQVFYARTSTDFSLGMLVSSVFRPDGASKIGFLQKGTGAKKRSLQDKARDFVTITDYEGVVGDGLTNCTDGINNAIQNNVNVEIPEGVFVCSPTVSSGDFMLYLGMANNHKDRTGLTIKGRGGNSILKLGDNVGRNALLFGAAKGDKIKDVTFRDMTIDLNGLSNLQNSFNDPLRYNSFAYFFCYCENVLFENITFLNASGHQVIRTGDDTAANYGKNIRVKNCRFVNYGMGVPGNKQQDCSAIYIQADGIEVTDCTFENEQFTYDPSRGHTGIELHGDSSTVVSRNRFRYCQMPWLMASSQKPTRNVSILDNRYHECFYLGSLDSGTYDQKVIDIGPGNIFNSTKSTAAVLRIGLPGEPAKMRENIRFFGNQVMLWGDANEDVHFCDLSSVWIRSLEIFGNRLGGLNGSVVYYYGKVQNTGYCELSIHDNELDSLGSAGGTLYPNSPTFLHIETTEGVINSLDFSNNKLSNSSLKDYSAFGLVKLTGSINYVNIVGNKNSLNSAFPLTTGTPATLYKNIAPNYPAPWQGSYYQSSGFSPITPNSNLTLFDFGAWTKNDFSSFNVTAFVTDGGDANNGVCVYQVLACGSGKVATLISSTGVYSSNVVVRFTGSLLEVHSTAGVVLFCKVAITGNSSRSVGFPE